MKSPLSTLSVGLVLSVAMPSNAQDALRGEPSRDSWFGTSGNDTTDPYETTNTRPPEVTPSQPLTSQPPAPAAPRVRRIRSHSVPIRFEPDDPSVRLLDQRGMMPFESVHYDWPGWWGSPYAYGYYHAMGAAPIYEPICDGPCMSRVGGGPHEFALAKPGGPIVPVPVQIAITEPSVVRARYVDRSDLRTAGVLIGVVGSLGGLVMMILSVHDAQECDASTCTTRSRVDGALAAGGLGLFAGSIVTSAVLINQKDKAQVSIAPLRLYPPEPRFDTRHSSRTQPGAQGASLSVRF